MFLGLVLGSIYVGHEVSTRSAQKKSGGGPVGAFGCKGPKNEALCLQLAQKWGPVFGCPVKTLMTIARIESDYRPTCTNLNTRAMKLGGAWGMCQMTWTAGKGHAAALTKSTDAEIKRVMAKWSPLNPRCLLDPELNVMFACRQLGNATKEFGDDIKLVAGAYHQGAGKIRQVLAANQPIPAALPPFGKIYVTSALKHYDEVRTA